MEFEPSANAGDVFKRGRRCPPNTGTSSVPIGAQHREWGAGFPVTCPMQPREPVEGTRSRMWRGMTALFTGLVAGKHSLCPGPPRGVAPRGPTPPRPPGRGVEWVVAHPPPTRYGPVRLSAVQRPGGPEFGTKGATVSQAM